MDIVACRAGDDPLFINRLLAGIQMAAYIDPFKFRNSEPFLAGLKVRGVVA